MKSTEFCFWLQGFFELSNPQELSVREVTLIKRHLALVFKHEIDPSHGSPEHQAELQAIHDNKPPKFGGVDADGNVYRC